MNLKNLNIAASAELKHILALLDNLAGGGCQIILWHREVDALKISATLNILVDLTCEPAIEIEQDNVIGTTVRLNQHQCKDDVVAAGLFQQGDFTGTLSGKSMLTYPVVLKDQVIGVIGIILDSQITLNTNTRDQMKQVAKLSSVVFENVVINRLSEQVNALSDKLKSITNPYEIMQRIVNAAYDLTGSDSSIIFLFEKETEKFFLGARIPQEDISSGLPRNQGLTRKIMDERPAYCAKNALDDPMAHYAMGKKRYQSLIGVRLEANGKKMGVFYVRKKQADYFSHYHVDVLKYLSTQVCSALVGSSHFFFEPSFAMQQATSELYHSEKQFKEITLALKQSWGFDSASIHLICHDQMFIETVFLDPPQGSTLLQQSSNQVKSSLEKNSMDNIFTKIVKQKTQIAIISGWCELFDRWSYDVNQHKNYVRLWLPIILLRDESNQITYLQPSQCEFETVVDREEILDPNYQEYGIKTMVQIHPLIGNRTLETIGVIELGFKKSNLKLPENLIAIVPRLFENIVLHAKDIRKTQLPYALEAIAKQTIDVLSAFSTSLHFPFTPNKSTFVACAGTGIADFLRKCNPRPDGLGADAIRDKTAKFCSGDSLKRDNPNAYRHGIRSMGAFPLFIGADHGVLYLHFQYERVLTQYEFDWIQHITQQMTHVIRNATDYLATFNSQRLLKNLHAIDLLLINSPESKFLLQNIVGIARNVLGADLVSIYEYNQRLGEISDPKRAGKLKQTQQREDDLGEFSCARLILTGEHSVFETNHDQPKHKEIFFHPNRADPTIQREHIKATAGIILEEGAEKVGVLFVNYRYPHAFENEMEIIDKFALSASKAIKTKQIHQQTKTNLEQTESHLEQTESHLAQRTKENRSLTALNCITLKSQNKKPSLNVILSYFLVGVTSGFGPGFSRAMLFLCEKSDSQLVGRMAIGEQNRKNAEKIWKEVHKENKTTFDDLLDSSKDFRTAVDRYEQDDTPLSLAVKKIKLDQNTLEGALQQCVFKQEVVTVLDSKSDFFRRFIQEISTPGDTGRAFVCVPLISNRNTTLGVLVADNRFLEKERKADFDINSLQAFAKFAAMAIENNRLEEKLAREQKMASTKESIEKMMYLIGQRLQHLDHKMASFESEISQKYQATDELSALTQGMSDTIASIKEDLDKFRLIGSNLEVRKWPIGLNHLFYALQQHYPELIEYNDNTHQSITFYGDENYINDAFIELIGNAKQAMRTSNKIRIIITLSLEAHWIYIDFVDFGPGVLPENKNRIFEPHHTTTSNAGLGLTIVREIIEAHGGTINEIGGSNEGAHFSITLPASQISLAHISPYRTSGGVTDASMFFGRGEILSHIFNRPLSNYFLVGARQLGKTSVLKAIERYYNKQPKISCHFIALSGTDLLASLARIFKSTQDAVMSYLQNPMQNQQRLLLIDEADAFVRADAENGFLLLKKLRAFSEQGCCHFIFAGFWELYKLAELDYHSPLKNFGEIHTLGELETQPCRQLCTKPMEVMSIHYESTQVVDNIIDSTGQRPNLIAILCNDILKALGDDRTIQSHHLTTAISSGSVNDALEGWRHMNANDPLADRLDRIIVYLTIEQQHFTQAQLLQQIRERGLPYEPEQIKDSLRRLTFAFILREENHHYHYRVPLFREKILAQDIQESLTGEIDALNQT